jgi:hypothetical protein
MEVLIMEAKQIEGINHHIHQLNPTLDISEMEEGEICLDGAFGFESSLFFEVKITSNDIIKDRRW